MATLLIIAILAGLYCFWGYLREKREREEAEEWSLQAEAVPEKKEEEETKVQGKEERMMNMGSSINISLL